MPPESPRALDAADLDAFMRDGFVRIDAAFDQETARQARAILWQATGCDPDDRSTWTRPVIRLDHFAQPPFRAAANTPVLHRAFDQLIGPGRWLPRQTLCGERMAFFRGPDKVVAAVEDFCPHRGAPLSLGSVRDGALVCGYHGLKMGCTGRTIDMPGQRVGGFPPIRVFPTIECYGFVWVWPGEASRADPAALHHLAWAESDAWTYGGGMFRVACDYRLMVDNLMDLTHETYVHASSIGQKEIDEAAVRTGVEGDQVVTSRHMENVQAPPFWQMALRGVGLPDDAPVDRWQVCRFSLPSHVLIEVGVALAGRGGYDADQSVKASSIVVDFITPETETSHWYFWGMARCFALGDDAMTDRIRAGQHTIFNEDLEMLERQQRNLLDYPDRKLMKLNIDAGGVRSRVMIDRAIATETAVVAPAVAA